jgi:hypothetical protein
MQSKHPFHPITGHEGPEVEYRYSSTLSLTSTLDGGGWSTPRPGRCTPGKDSVPIVYEAEWAPEPVWMGAENLAPTGIRSPDRPGRSESVYRLHYPGPQSKHPSFFKLKKNCKISYNYVSNLRAFSSDIVLMFLVK